jgi:hypothetical protein
LTVLKEDMAENDPFNLFAVMPILVEALRIAEEASASEISIDHILDALGAGPRERINGSSQQSFFSVPQRDMAFTAGVRAALETVETQHDVTPDVLRQALLKAKQEGLQ